LFALPDPASHPAQASGTAHPLQVSQAVQDFSVMVRLQHKQSHRRRNWLLALAAIAVVAAVIPLLGQKARYDEGIDAARQAKKLVALLSVAYADSEEVQVLAFAVGGAGTPAAAAPLAAEASAVTPAPARAERFSGTTLSQRVFSKVRQERALRLRRR
jgi:hypothetical protein